MEWLTCVRPSSGALPRVEVVSRSEIQRRVTASPGDSDEQRRHEEWLRGLAMFRLAPQEYDRKAQQKAQTQDLAGVYVPKDKSVLVVDSGELANKDQAVANLVHEFVHALQDAELELGEYRAKWGGTFDAALAITGLVEGEAVLYQSLAQVEMRGFSPDQFAWSELFEEWRTQQLVEAELDASPVEMAHIRFPYAFGGGFMTQKWLSGGRPAIDAVFAAPPRTTREILFGPANEDLGAGVSDIRAHGLPVLAPEFETQDFATLGAWIARIYVGQSDLFTGERWQLARVLAADVFTVQRDAATGRSVAAWRLRSLAAHDLELWQTEVPAYVSMASSNQGRALDLVASHPGFPPQPQTLEWKSIEKPEMASSAATSSLLCASRFPADHLSELLRR